MEKNITTTILFFFKSWPHIINGKIHSNANTAGGLGVMCPWCACVHREGLLWGWLRTQPPGGLGDRCSLHHILGDTLKGDDSWACFCLNFREFTWFKETRGWGPQGTWWEGGRASTAATRCFQISTTQTAPGHGANCTFRLQAPSAQRCVP